MNERISYDVFSEKYIFPFRGVEHHYDTTVGFVVWRRGTGDNVELLHIRTFNPGRGDGRRLFHIMLNRLATRPPYHSIFGFTRVGNEEAKAFYGALGFHLQIVEGLYAEGRATIFWQKYEVLRSVQAAYDWAHGIVERPQPKGKHTESTGP